MSKDSVVLIGYSGHACVVCDIFATQEIEVFAYCDVEEKKTNPYGLSYLGEESSPRALEQIASTAYFVAIGNNAIRKKINRFLFDKTDQRAINAIHKSALISPMVSWGHGVMVGPGAVINSCSLIAHGVICNSQSVIEHDCQIGAYSHVAPGAVLCGNVRVGQNCFIGAGSVVKEGVRIGDNVTVGAGTVVIRDIPDNVKVVGNPQKII